MKHVHVAIFIFWLLAIFSCSKERRSDKKGEKMQEFVVEISRYAREFDSDFIVVPQNGAELAFQFLDPAEGIHADYASAIDGIGVEELFYNGTYLPDQERLSMLRELKLSKKIMVADFLSDNSQTTDAIQKNNEEGFICFPRQSSNYDYKEIPSFIINENVNPIHQLSDAQNYLYLINSSLYSSKTDFLSALSATNFDVLLIDLFFGETALTSADIQQLKTKQNGASRLVLAYMNIGSAEKYRYYWNEKWKLHRPKWLKKPYEGYPDEIWVKFWDKDWQNIIFGNNESYTKKVLDAGFDGVYLDNVEAYYFLYFE